jgi:nicotinate-nucleotide adenylyltransferase
MPKPRCIGLFPGSFNPAHDGHLHVARAGLRQLALDEIWWIPSPQNPLKSNQPPYDERAASVSKLGLPPHMRLCHIERERGTNKTIDLLKSFKQRGDMNRYILMIGADNFAQLPLWIEWKNITAHVPIAVIARPDSTGLVNIRPRLGRAARELADARINESHAHILKWASPPAWCYLTLPMNGMSSTQLRAEQTTK